jgi:uncharacterized protein (DUF1800 family)
MSISLARSKEHTKKLTTADATHLLWRLGFGASRSAIDAATKEGLQAIIDRCIPSDSANVPEESREFVDAEPLLKLTALDSSNIQQLKAWWLYRMRFSNHTVLERISLLWHNHFATSNAKVKSVPHMFAQNELIRKHALGSFRALLHGMAKDVAMLLWLDSNSNRKRQANENFAREIMELFSLGVGNYTEKDIQEAARAFTGWHVRNDKFWFNKIQHDYGNKTVFGKTDNFDGNHIVDLCLEQPAGTRFVSLKLLREFVTDTPDKELIESLAVRIRHHNYEMTPILRELFTSEAFFSKQHRQAIIKSPVQLVVGAYRSLNVRPNLNNTSRIVADLGQNLFEPPSVKGWEGGRLWVNSATMLQRMNFAGRLCSGSQLGQIDASVCKSAAESPQAIAQFLTGAKLPAEAIAEFERLEIESSENKGRRVLHAIMSLPEFQLS